MNIDKWSKNIEYKDGVLYWKKSGKVAGSKTQDGYIRIQLNGERIHAHRIVYAMFNGSFDGCIDHIDGNKLNNRIDNLRLSNHTTNGYNRKINCNNKSGVSGVFWQHNKWIVRIKVNSKPMYFGRFEDIELAKLVAEEARLKYHKEFANVSR